MALSPLYNRNICQKRILALKLSLIYCEPKIVADSLFVDLFHAVAVRTTLLFRKEFLVKTTSTCFHVIVAFYTSIQQCPLPDQPLKWICDRYTTDELVVIRKILRAFATENFPSYLFTQTIHFSKWSALFVLSAIKILMERFRQMRKCGV